MHDNYRKSKHDLSVLQTEANEEMPTGIAGFQAAKEVSPNGNILNKYTFNMFPVCIGSRGREGFDHHTIRRRYEAEERYR